ncbi:MAG: LCP family protein [Clostridia bacterium]|nr:LCP family protein [Clostridia bacterium]
MNEQNKNSSSNNSQPVKSQRRKVNRKPSAASSVAVAVLISLFVVLMAVAVIVGVAFFYEKENPNKGNIDDYVDYSTDEYGNRYYHSVNANGETVVVSVDDNDLHKDQYNFLVIGKDRAAFNTDVLIVVSYNIDDGSVSMMQIPRDTYVQLPDKNGNLRGRKINSQLAVYYNQAHVSGVSYSEALSAACSHLTASFSEILGIPINNYVMLDLEGFVNIVDAIGGVDLEVPRDMYYKDPEQGLYINLKKGYQNLNGDEAEQFIRFRKGYVNADLGRVDAQKIFISAFIEKVQKSFSVDTIVNIVDQLSKYVVTDVSLKDMLYFAKNALSVNPDNITMFTMPGDVSGKYYVAYREDTYNMVNTYLNPYKVPLKSDNFDPNGSLYDAVGTSMYGVYTKTYSGNNIASTYSAGDTSDIHIPSVSTTAVTAAIVTSTVADTSSSQDEDVIHTTPEKADITNEPDIWEETTIETTDATVESPSETTGESFGASITSEPADIIAEPDIIVTETSADTVLVTTAEPEETVNE